MKQIILVLAMVVAWAYPMKAGEADDIRDVIAAQFAAFLDSDVDEAFGYASTGIRKLFVTAESFGAMVETGYPMVWRPADTRFLELREIDGVLWQKVMVRDGDGAWHLLDYQMVAQDEGWRIDGVQFLRQADVGV